MVIIHCAKMDKFQKAVVKLCLRSRLEITLLAIGCDLLLPDHDADAYRNKAILANYDTNSTHLSLVDRSISTFTSPFIKWDAQYFLAIAEHNSYPEESMLAFFPLYPLIIRNVALFLQTLLNLFTLDINFISSLALSAYLVNLVSFVLAGLLLFNLSTFMFNSVKVSFEIVNFFAYNPASIFFTAFYTESLFSCLTFFALWCLYRFKSPFYASILFGLSTTLRSNGKH